MPLNNILDVIKQYWYFIPIIVLGFVVFILLTKRKSKPVIIRRSEIERQNFLDRNKYNRSYFKWVYRGEKLIGQLAFMSAVKMDNNLDVFELGIDPALFGLKIPNPFSKRLCFMVLASDLNRDWNNNSLVIMENAIFDKFMGVYYSKDLGKFGIKFITEDSVFRTDWDLMMSIYYTKAQEQATFNPVSAIDIQKEQLKLEQEKEKRYQLVKA